MKTLRQTPAKELYNYIKLNWVEQSIYFWVDVWKEILDIWVTIGNSNVQVYLWSINNTASGFKQVEDVIMNLILLWINENNIYFWTENTWIYWHDIMNYFSDRIPNTYILNSSLTCHARQYYATSNFKNDEVDSVMIATTLQDLNNKWRLESVNNPYKRWCGMWVNPGVPTTPGFSCSWKIPPFLSPPLRGRQIFTDDCRWPQMYWDDLFCQIYFWQNLLQFRVKMLYNLWYLWNKN